MRALLRSFHAHLTLPTAPGLRLRPFRAVRHNPATAGELSDVICPPYDDIGGLALLVDQTARLRCASITS
ncbi:hypothetical protein ACH4EC_23965 [Streptomyces anulatus]